MLRRGGHRLSRGLGVRDARGFAALALALALALAGRGTSPSAVRVASRSASCAGFRRAATEGPPGRGLDPGRARRCASCRRRSSSAARASAIRRPGSGTSRGGLVGRWTIDRPDRGRYRLAPELVLEDALGLVVLAHPPRRGRPPPRRAAARGARRSTVASARAPGRCAPRVPRERGRRARGRARSPGRGVAAARALAHDREARPPHRPRGRGPSARGAARAARCRVAGTGCPVSVAGLRVRRSRCGLARGACRAQWDLGVVREPGAPSGAGRCDARRVHLGPPRRAVLGRVGWRLAARVPAPASDRVEAVRRHLRSRTRGRRAAARAAGATPSRLGRRGRCGIVGRDVAALDASHPPCSRARESRWSCFDATTIVRAAPLAARGVAGAA